MAKPKKERRKRRAFARSSKPKLSGCVGDRTIAQVAADLDLTENSLREWMKRAEIDAGNGPDGALSSDERAELMQLRRENKRLQMEREILKNGGLLREGEHVKFKFILAEKASYSIAVLCHVFGVSRSGFHAWRKRPQAPRARIDSQLAAQVAAVHNCSRRTYGSPRIHAELRARGVRGGKKRIERLMRENGLQVRRKRRFRRTTDSRHSLPITRNIVARRFRVAAPNRVWVTDVAAIWTLQGRLYLAAMLDLYSRRGVGWAISESNDTRLALEALQRALARRRQDWCTTPIAEAPTPAPNIEPRWVAQASLPA